MSTPRLVNVLGRNRIRCKAPSRRTGPHYGVLYGQGKAPHAVLGCTGRGMHRLTYLSSTLRLSLYLGRKHTCIIAVYYKSTVYYPVIVYIYRDITNLYFTQPMTQIRCHFAAMLLPEYRIGSGTQSSTSLDEGRVLAHASSRGSVSVSSFWRLPVQVWPWHEISGYDGLSRDTDE